MAPELAVQKPGLLLAGRNPVCTDAVGTAVMGYDPMAASDRAVPRRQSSGHGRRMGLGTNDPKEIEVLGLSVTQACTPSAGNRACETSN